MVYAESIKYPFTSGKDLLLAYVLLAVPFLNFLSGFFVYGYVIHAAKSANQKKLPEFTGAAHLFVDGIKVVLLIAIYAIPILLSLALWLASKALAVVLVTLFGAMAVFMLPTVLVAFSQNHDFKSALNVKNTFSKSFSMPMIKAWLIALLVGIAYLAAGIILSFFTQITYIGPYLSMAFAVVLIVFTTVPLFVQAYQRA